MVEGVAVPELGTQVTLNPPVVGCAPEDATVPTCEGAGVAACGCAAVVDGDEAVGVVAPTVLPVVPDCATVPTGHGFVPAPNPPVVGVGVFKVPVPAPGEVPGIAVVFMPGVWPGVVPDAVPGVTLGSVPCGVAMPGAVGVGVGVVWV